MRMERIFDVHFGKKCREAIIMKDWILEKIKENNANNVIAFPLRQEDVERRLRNAILDKDRRGELENAKVDD